jgi:mRNA interferase RelE/StbE
LAWTIEFDPRALKELEKLDRTSQKRVVGYLQKRVVGARTPRDLGRALTGDKIGLWRYRVGELRLVCRLADQNKIVSVLRIGHRRDIYR